MYNKTLKKTDLKKNKQEKTLKKKSLMKIESIKSFDKTIKNNYNNKSSMTYNTEFIKLLNELEELMKKKGEFFRARAYTKAKEKLILYKKPITDVNELKGIKGIGNTILNKLQEYVDTGTLQVLEKAKKIQFTYSPMFMELVQRKQMNL